MLEGACKMAFSSSLLARSAAGVQVWGVG